MSFIQQLIQLLTEAPGSIVYHIVTLFSIQAALGLALWQWRRTHTKDSADPLARRLVWAMSGILFARLTIIVALLVTSDQALAARILPPLEQAVDAVTIAIIVWVFAPRLPTVPLLGEVVLLIVLLFTGFMYAFFAQSWINMVDNGLATSYLASGQTAVWNIFQLLMLLIGVVLVILGRQPQWALRLAILFILLVGHLAQLLTDPATVPTSSDIAYWVRLGNLFALPLLVILVYRYNLTQLLSDQAVYHSSAEQLSRHLQISRSVIDSLDVNNTMNKALRMAAELVHAEYTALAVISLNNPNQLHLVSTHHPTEKAGDGSQSQIRRQSWALNLTDWPAIRLAMQQRQRVELIPNGLGARQLHDIYHELGLHGLGSLLIEPLVVSENELGVLLLAGPAMQERWPAEEKSVSFVVASFLAQAIQNARQYQQALQETSGMTAADETVVSGRLIAQEQSLNQAQAEIESLTARWKHAESLLAAESQRSRDLAVALETAEQFNRDERVKALEQEVASLRESLIEAEEAMALASAGEAGLSPEWVTTTITRYSSEVEEAMARIQQLENRLAQQEDSQTRALIASLAQELRTPLTSLGGYSDLLLGESMGILGTKQLSLMRRVKANITHMSSLLEQLIQLSTKRSSPISNEAQVNIRETIETAISSVSSKLREKSLRLDLDLADNLPVVPSDGDAFYQIVVHLLNNACQVSKSDTRIILSAHYDSIQERGLDGDVELFDFLHLTVTDSGNGLSQEIHSLVLEAHRRPGMIEASKMQEVGHSLSKAISLVNAQGGRVWLSKEWDTGDTLTVLLPLSGNGYVYTNGKRAA